MELVRSRSEQGSIQEQVRSKLVQGHSKPARARSKLVQVYSMVPEPGSRARNTVAS